MLYSCEKETFQQYFTGASVKIECDSFEKFDYTTFADEVVK